MAIFRYSLICICLLIPAVHILGQTSSILMSDLRELDSRSMQNRWMRLSSQGPMAIEDIPTLKDGPLAASSGINLVLDEIKVDELGLTRSSFLQHVGEVPVLDAFIYVYGYGRIAQWAHGRMLPRITLATQPRIDASRALKYYFQGYPNHTYAWQDTSWENALKRDVNDAEASYLPEGELVILPLYLADQPGSGYALCWQFEIRTTNPDDVWKVWIDANSGKIRARQSASRACNSFRGTFESSYYDTRGVDTRKGKQLGDDYVLKDCRGAGIHTKYHRLNRFGATASWAWTQNIRHNGTDWRSADQHATTAHWAAQGAWDYFAETFDWHGPHNEGLPLRIWVDWQKPDGSPMPNARYLYDRDRHYLYLGQFGGDPMTTLDIIGHEFAHGIIERTAGLSYHRESGALNESFADILGTLVERAVLGEDFDWVIGSELGGFRSFSHPQEYAQPRAYGNSDPYWVSNPETQCGSGTNWEPNSEVACDVHINSGVQNRWFYLLSEGGIQSQVNVYGIGVDRAAQIVFRSLTTYLQPYDTYPDARMASIQAAADLYGECSDEVAQVKNAWAAVGVGGQNLAVCAEIWGAENVCKEDLVKELTYEAKAISGTEFTWDPLPLGWGYSISGEMNQYLTLTYIPDDAPPLNISLSAKLGGIEVAVEMHVIMAECKTDSNSTTPETGTGRLKFPEVRLIPNPCRDKVTVYLPEGRYPALISLYDIQGRQIHQEEVFGSEALLQTGGIPKGTYLIQVKNQTENSFHRLLHIR